MLTTILIGLGIGFGGGILGTILGTFTHSKVKKHQGKKQYISDEIENEKRISRENITQVTLLTEKLLGEDAAHEFAQSINKLEIFEKQAEENDKKRAIHNKIRKAWQKGINKK